MGNKTTRADAAKDLEVRVFGAGDPSAKRGDIGLGAAGSLAGEIDPYSDGDIEPDEDVTPLPNGLFHLRQYGETGVLLYPSTVVNAIGQIAAARIQRWRSRAERRRIEGIVARRDRIDLQRRIDHARDVLSTLKHSHGRVPKAKMVEQIAAALEIEL